MFANVFLFFPDMTDFSCQPHSQDTFALLIVKIPGAGADSVSEVQCKHSKWFSRGKIKFLKWLLLESFFSSSMLMKEKKKRARRTFFYHTTTIERGVVFPAFTVLYSCSLRSLSQMEGWRSTTWRSNPNICLATTEAFSQRQNTGQLCAIPLQMIILFDWE